MSGERGRMESCVSMSEFSPLEEVLESEPVVEAVPVDVHERDKEDSDEDWEEGSDEVFPDKISKGKNEKKRK